MAWIVCILQRLNYVHNSETVIWQNLSNWFVQKGSTFCFNMFCQQWHADFSKSRFDFHMGGKKACKNTQTNCNVQIFFTISPSYSHHNIDSNTIKSFKNRSFFFSLSGQEIWVDNCACLIFFIKTPTTFEVHMFV